VPLSLQEAFSSREDPRVERDKRHKLMDIIMLAICAVMSGTNGREVLNNLVKTNRNVFRTSKTAAKYNEITAIPVLFEIKRLHHHY